MLLDDIASFEERVIAEGNPTYRVLDRTDGVTASEPTEIDRLAQQTQVESGDVVAIRHIEPVVAFARRVALTHPIAIATGGQREIALPALKAAGLQDLFSIVVTPRDVGPGRGKPAPDMFLLAAEKMGVAAERCLVFEDAEPGIRAAQAAGMAVVRVPSRAG